MSLLTQVTSGVIARPQKVIIYGPEGVGKTTLASQWPSPLFLDTEGGTAQIEGASRLDCPDWQHISGAVKELSSSASHGFKTVIIDTIDWAEKCLIDFMLATKTDEKGRFVKGIEDYGYGKGYVYIKELMSEFLYDLNTLIKQGVNVVMLAHSTLKKVEKPEIGEAYDHYELKLTKNNSPILKEWCDALLFLNFDVSVIDGKAKGGKERVIMCNHCAAFDAKNRHSLPDYLPAEVRSLAALLSGSGQKVEKPPASEAKKEENPQEVNYAKIVQEKVGDLTPVLAGFLASIKYPVDSWDKLPLSLLKRIADAPEAFVNKANEFNAQQGKGEHE